MAVSALVYYNWLGSSPRRTPVYETHWSLRSWCLAVSFRAAMRQNMDSTASPVPALGSLLERGQKRRSIGRLSGRYRPWRLAGSTVGSRGTY